MSERKEVLGCEEGKCFFAFTQLAGYSSCHFVSSRISVSLLSLSLALSLFLRLLRLKTNLNLIDPYRCENRSPPRRRALEPRACDLRNIRLGIRSDRTMHSSIPAFQQSSIPTNEGVQESRGGHLLARRRRARRRKSGCAPHRSRLSKSRFPSIRSFAHFNQALSRRSLPRSLFSSIHEVSSREQAEGRRQIG